MDDRYRVPPPGYYLAAASLAPRLPVFYGPAGGPDHPLAAAASFPLRQSPGDQAQISQPPPVIDIPLSIPNPFDFDRYYNNMQSRYIWDKLLFEPKPLSDNAFYRQIRDYKDPTGFLDPRPMGPQENAPILEPYFR